MNPLPAPRPTLVLMLLTGVFLSACNPAEKPEKTPAASEAPNADAFLILPGDYAAKTTVADLEARFGAANVLRETVPEPQVVLFPEDPTRRAHIFFHDEEAFKDLARISVEDPGSLWRGKHGVHLGMTFAKVRELNGKPFYYDGFNGKKRAWVRDGWSPSLDDDDSTLGAFDTAENEHLYFEIEFGPDDTSQLKSGTDLPDDEYLLSDDPRFPRLGERILVTQMSAWNSLDDEWE